MTKPALSYSLLDTEFLFSSFLIHFEATETVTLPANRGSAFRGAFGRAFRRIECRAPNSDCGDCLLDRHCILTVICSTQPRRPGPVRPYILNTIMGSDNITRAIRSLLYSPWSEKALIFYLCFWWFSRKWPGGGLGRGRGRCVLKEIVSLGDDYPKTLYKQTRG